MAFYKILVPLNFNDGSKVPASLLDEAADLATRIAGGVTLGAPVAGRYVNEDGRQYVDALQPFEIACTRAQAVEFAQWVAAAFNQESVFVSHVVSDCFLVRRQG